MPAMERRPDGRDHRPIFAGRSPYRPVRPIGTLAPKGRLVDQPSAWRDDEQAAP
jgi:hypothetical protein